MNLEQYIGAITAFDSIISGNLYYDNAILEDSKYGEILSHLFSHYIESKPRNVQIELPSYIYQTFAALIQHKEKIIIDMDDANNYVRDRILVKLLFNDMVKEKDSSWIDIDNNQNIIKSDVLELLYNVNEMKIRCAFDYPFSLLQYLSIIEKTSLVKVSFVIGWRAVSSLKSWTYFDEIRNEYQAKQFEIKLDGYYVYINKC